MTDIDMSEGTTEDVAANFLREAFAQGKHGPSDGWALWPRAERLSAAIEAEQGRIIKRREALYQERDRVRTALAAIDPTGEEAAS